MTRMDEILPLSLVAPSNGYDSEK